MAENPFKRQFQNFPVPNLDDRSFQDLMEEMRSLIPVYCPEWTNHNPSDPGITLLELFAFLSEVMLYRVNRVPVRNLFSLLDVLGVQPSPPAPARVPLVITPNATAQGYLLRRGTQVGARRAGAGEPLVFETEHDLLLTTSRLTRVIASNGQETRDVTDLVVGGQNQPFSPFAGTAAIERYLYLSDGRFLTLREQGMRVHIKFQGPSSARDLYARWIWQYHNGESWVNARLAVGQGSGEVVLDSQPDMSEATVNGVTGPWLRAIPLPGEQEISAIRFEEIEVEVKSVEEGVVPDAIFLNPGGDTVFSNIDTSRVFYPMGEDPQRESSLYIMARELFRAAGTRVELEFVQPDEDAYPRPDPSPELTLRIEYPVLNSRWGLIRTITPNPLVVTGDNRFQLEDKTRSLKRGGTISFVVPDDMADRDINGALGPWIRIRLVNGEYRAPQAIAAEQATIEDDTAMRPVGPAFQALYIRSRAPAAPVKRAQSYSDFTLMEVWDGNRPRGSASVLFPVREAYTCALYLGFTGPFPPGTSRLFFKVRDDGEAYSESWERDIAMQRVKWEVATRSGFVPLPQAQDDTLHLKRDGYLTFTAPHEPEKAALFEESAYWIRARLTEGRYDVTPQLEDIRLNTVDALHVNTQVENRVLPSDGQAYQEFKLLRSPVLGNVRVWVKEKEPPRSPEALQALEQELGEGAIEEDEEGSWCRWKAVDHFFRAGPDSRCFRVDPLNGVLLFGDGLRGKIPPPGNRAIRIDSYWIGGGARGNVGPHTLSVLKEGNSQVDEVDNPFPSDGGTEVEDLTDAARRGTRQMFTVDRAYRSEDFEQLAKQASRRVARVSCLAPRPTERGGPRRSANVDFGDEERIRVIIIPTQEPGPQAMRERLLPSQELIRRVDRYLEARRTLNTRLIVRGPRYVPFGVTCTVYLRGRMSSGVEEDIERRLFAYLNPLTGGEDGRGWPLGQSVRRVSLFQVVSGSPLVLSVMDLRLMDKLGSPIDGAVQLKDDQLPHLIRVKVETAELK